MKSTKKKTLINKLNDVHYLFSSPDDRPSTRELIQRGIEPAPGEEDMYDKDNAVPPKFKYQLKSQLGLVEAQPAHFETRLIPIGDPNMQVVWYKDNQPLSAGTIHTCFF